VRGLPLSKALLKRLDRYYGAFLLCERIYSSNFDITSFVDTMLYKIASACNMYLMLGSELEDDENELLSALNNIDTMYVTVGKVVEITGYEDRAVIDMLTVLTDKGYLKYTGNGIYVLLWKSDN
jgi:hypothetical protein